MKLLLTIRCLHSSRRAVSSPMKSVEKKKKLKQKPITLESTTEITHITPGDKQQNNFRHDVLDFPASQQQSQQQQMLQLQSRSLLKENFGSNF